MSTDPDQIRSEIEQTQRELSADVDASHLVRAAHLAKADESVVGFNFDNGSNEASPVDAVRMTQRRFKRNRNGCSANVFNLHGDSRAKQYQLQSPQKSRDILTSPHPALRAFALPSGEGAAKRRVRDAQGMKIPPTAWNRRMPGQDPD